MSVHPLSVEAGFAPKNGPVILIANPASLFPHQLAQEWRQRGMDVRLVSNRPSSQHPLFEGAPVLDSGEDRTGRLGRMARAIVHMVQRAERHALTSRGRQAREAVGAYEGIPSITPVVEDAISISRYVRSLRPQFVFGMEAFAYGLATACCWGVPRILMPWGGDVFLFANTTRLASAAVTYSLRNVDLIVPTSLAAKEYIHRRFGVPTSRIQPISWGIDRSLFSRAEGAARTIITARYGIPRDAFVIMNVRRFRPLWGSDLALDAFIRFARECSKSHFILLGGAGTEPLVAAARQRLAREQLLHRFVLIDGDLPLAECAALMSVSDVFVSLMRAGDMRSWSILQAAAAGGVPVLTDSAEHRNLERFGFRAALVNPEDTEAVVAALRHYAEDPDLRQRTCEQNLRYLDVHESSQQNHTRMLDLIARVCRRYRRPGSFCLKSSDRIV